MTLKLKILLDGLLNIKRALRVVVVLLCQVECCLKKNVLLLCFFRLVLINTTHWILLLKSCQRLKKLILYQGEFLSSPTDHFFLRAVVFNRRSKCCQWRLSSRRLCSDSRSWMIIPLDDICKKIQCTA